MQNGDHMAQYFEDTGVISSLDFRSLQVQSDGDSWITHCIRRNRDTLQELVLGREQALESTRIPAKLHSILTGLVEATELTLPNLASFGMIGVDLTELNHTIGSKLHCVGLLNWKNLRRLALEYCPGSRTALEKLITLFRSGTTNAPTIALKEFVFQYSHPDRALLEALQTFLLSIPGLRLLSVLLTFSPSFFFETFIPNHGATLEALTWQVSNYDRSDSHDEDSDFPVDDTWKFCSFTKRCPRLKELSMLVPWDSLHKDDLEDLIADGLSRLPLLRTLHIGNTPAYVESFRVGEKTYNDSLCRICALEVCTGLAKYSTKAPPVLDLLAIGPLRFRERWNPFYDLSDLSMNDMCCDPIEQTMFFGVDYARSSRMNTVLPMLKELGSGDFEIAKAYSDHLRIFESYLLE